jgi:hypothetical protein
MYVRYVFLRSTTQLEQGRIMIEDVSDWIKSALEGLSPMYEQYMKLGMCCLVPHVYEH